MNKIEIVNDKIASKKINKNIKIYEYQKQDLFDINKVIIEVLKSCDIRLTIDISLLSKLKIDIKVFDNCDCNIYIYTNGDKSKIKYSYNILSNSNLKVFKYNNISTINEMVEVNLDGDNARIDYLFKSIAEDKESYDYAIFHNHKNTYSNIYNNIVNLKGNVNIQISSSIPKSISDCICNQYNRIINLTENKCEIRPILYIDNDNVDANHSALIGEIEADELFYLETMGISKKDAYRLLINGFLINGITDSFLSKKICDDIKKYWR